MRTLTLVVLLAVPLRAVLASEVTPDSSAVATSYERAATAIYQSATAASYESAAAPYEIVVTATKRQQSLLEVPVAVSSISAEALGNIGAADVFDLQRVAASINLSTSQNQTNTLEVRVRGIGTPGNNTAFESSVGVFIDDFYQSRPGIALGELVDIDQVELLRGPQGTLFGRNTPAGAINIRTRMAAIGDQSGFASFALGSDSLRHLQLAQGLAINDQAAARFALSVRDRDGDLTAEKPGVDDPNGIERYLLRGSLLLLPSEYSRLELRADHAASESNCCSAVLVSGLTPALPSPALNALFGAETVDPERRIAPGDNAFEDTDQTGLSLRYHWLRDKLEVEYLASWRDFSSDIWGEADFVSSDFVFIPQESPNRTEAQTQTHELRLKGLAFNDRLDWLLGAYAIDETISQRLNFTAGVATDAALAALADLLGPDFSPSTTPVAGASAESRFKQQTSGYALFSHNIVRLSDDVSWTLGLRYSDERKTGGLQSSRASRPEACFDGLASLGAIDSPIKQLMLESYCLPVYSPLSVFAGVNESSFNARFADDALSYSTSLSYSGFDNSLIYFSSSSGFKSGGINLELFGSGLRFPTFASEKIRSQELGYKWQAADKRLSASAVVFYSALDNLQNLQFDGSEFKVFSLPQVTSRGLELDIDWQPGERWQASLSYALLDTRADLAPGFGGSCNQFAASAAAPVCGSSELPNAPRHSVVGSLEYRLALPGPYTLSILPALNYLSSSKPDSANLDFQQGSSTVVDLRMVIDHAASNIRIDLWGSNLTDELTLTSAFRTVSAAIIGGSSQSSFVNAGRRFGMSIKKTW